MNVTFNGNVTAQAAAGETVTVTVTTPGGATSTTTGTTDASGNYTTGTLTFNVAGTYSFVASIPADSQYEAEETSPQTFAVALANRTLTVTVTPS